MSTTLIKPLTILLILSISITQQLSDGTIKAQQLRNMAKQTHDGLINFDGQSFDHYVQQEPRPYDVVILFVSKDCEPCDNIKPMLAEVYSIYKRSAAIYPNNQQKQRSVFFGVVDFSKDTAQIYRERDFVTVPNIVYYSSRVNKMTKVQQKLLIKTDYQWTISGNDRHPTVQKVLDFVNHRSKRTIVYKEPIINLLFVIVVLGAIFVAIVKMYQSLWKYLIDPKLWLIAALLAYWICLSGVVYTVTQDAPFTRHDSNGNMVWYKKERGQLGMEGLVMSLCLTMAGITLLVAVEGVRQIRSFTYIQYLIFAVSTAVLVKTLIFIDQMHRMKQNYNPTFYPPEHFIRGPLINDQGNSF